MGPTASPDRTTLRWAERDYFLPKVLTAGQARLTVALEPTAGAPAWDAAEYRVISVVRPVLP
ncbi:MAG: hypothetical protein QOI66_5016 [Myxococcales bacterium]|jgi:hypothetical protein|nr:hypothetical protein [Myxococcales bacterium]